MNAVSTTQATPRRYSPLHVTMMAAMYCLPVAIALRGIVDVDIWWHLHQAAWIVQNKTLPVTDPFTSYGMGKTWIAYSWLYELVVYALYQRFGLFGIVLYTTLLGVAITLALHRLLLRQTAGFALASALTALAVAAMLPVLAHPRPWLFNVLFFIVELTVLLEVRRSGCERLLWTLPPLFLIWACINIQFVYGLFVLFLAAVEPAVERWMEASRIDGKFRTKAILLTVVASFIATCLTPYHLRIYIPVITAVRLTDPFLFLSELHAPSFRHVFDWMALALLVAAVYTVGSRRIASPFIIMLLATGACFGFRARRDIWFLVIASVTVLATAPVRPAIARMTLGVARLALVVTVVLAFFGWLRATRVAPTQLERELATTFPVKAAAFVEARGYTGELFNHYDWGGYLMWRLPMLNVGLDGRNPVHGDARIWRSIRTWRGQRDWAADPELGKARVVIADVNTPLASLLRGDKRFTLVYEDDVAVVFTRG